MVREQYLMLNKEEEQRLKGIIEKIVTCKMDLKYPKLNSYDIEWLAWKLKETNEELKKVARERDILQKQYVEGA